MTYVGEEDISIDNNKSRERRSPNSANYAFFANHLLTKYTCFKFLCNKQFLLAFSVFFFFSLKISNVKKNIFFSESNKMI